MPLITVTDSFGTNGNEIARAVAQDLGVGLFDDKRLQLIVKKTEVSVRTDYRFDQQAPGFWELIRSREPQVYLDLSSVILKIEEFMEMKWGRNILPLI